MKSLSLSKSRDYLNESTKQLSRAQEKFSNFKTISKSQEVLSPALGGNMKRMVAGAVSDIPAHNLPINPRVYLDTQVKNDKNNKKSRFWFDDKEIAGGLLGLCDGSWQLSVDVPL